MNKNTLIAFMAIILVMWGIHYFADLKFTPPTPQEHSTHTPPEQMAGNVNEPQTAFERAVPKPVWWNNVDADKVTINSYDDLITYWQSEKRCCSEEEIKDTNRKFYKTAYLAALKHQNNPDIVVNALNMMDLSYLGVRDFTAMQLYALETYPDYNKPLHNCANCKTGDVIASILEELGDSMRSNGRQEDFIHIAKDFLSKRGKDMSEYYEARVYLQIAHAYNSLSQKDMTINTLSFILNRYESAPRTGSMKSTLKSAQRMLEQLQSS